MNRERTERRYRRAWGREGGKREIDGKMGREETGGSPGEVESGMGLGDGWEMVGRWLEEGWKRVRLGEGWN